MGIVKGESDPKPLGSEIPNKLCVTSDDLVGSRMTITRGVLRRYGNKACAMPDATSEDH